MLDTQYGSCIEQAKLGSGAPGDYGPERVCTELITNVLGPGTITQQNQEEGITEAICIRVLIEKPYMTPNEQIPMKIRIASKVAYLQNGQWNVAQDLYTLDSALWDSYNCPGKFDLTTIEEWKDEYNSR